MNWVSASVKGVKAPRVPNQDILKVEEFESCFLAVLADGLGSAKFSRLGAKLARDSVERAFLKRNESTHGWIETIPAVWKELVSLRRKRPADCATTCAIVVVNQSTKTVTKATLGDTSVFVKTDQCPCRISNSREEFLNETACLGSTNHQEFQIEEFTYSKTVEILMATDGIAADLEVSKLDGFMAFLKASFEGLSKSKSRSFLRKSISGAFSKMNNDDKSMIYAWLEN